MTYAKIIADSISPEGVRLTSMEIRIHRKVLSELNTHRTFSRNSGSHRAIPVAKLLARVREDPATPLAWPQEKKGMQGGEPLSPADEIAARALWDEAKDNAVASAECLVELGLHKSLTNRLIEPWLWQTVLITSTAWQNFFSQRCSPLAQTEIRVAAEMMRDAMEASTPDVTLPGEWHLPYIQAEDCKGGFFHDTADPEYWGTLAKVSAARSARVSYLTQDGKRDMGEDLTMYDRLTSADPPHWSPLEHVATPWGLNRQEGCIHFGQDEHSQEDTFSCVPLDHLPRTGNLLGWRSLRTEVEAAQHRKTYS